jgi:FkbM family methyltransferase
LTWRQTWYRLSGVLRSVVIYWRPGRQRGLRRLYAPFVSDGDLVFDIGAHLGDRSVAFADLGARVIALEPQPAIRRLLRWIVRGRAVTVRGEAVGAASGVVQLAVSPFNPTVSSASGDWRSAVKRNNQGFRRVQWSEELAVPLVTLDELIAEYGVPVFCKIDVEGFEQSVLAGLSTPLEGLSFEFVAGALDEARACLAQLKTLASYRFNVIGGEGRQWWLDAWSSLDWLDDWLARGADGLQSGDIYAVRARTA